MSYSRWGSRGSGHWYTYWQVQADETEDRDTSIFVICSVASFTAKQLRENIDNCMDQVKKVDGEGDIDELKIYAMEFLSDVDAEYPAA